MFLLHESTSWLISNSHRPNGLLKHSGPDTTSDALSCCTQCTAPETGKHWSVLKSAQVSCPLPIHCGKAAGAELMLLKSCTSRHVLLSDVLSRPLPGCKQECGERTQSWFGKQKRSVLPRKRWSVPCVMPFLDSYLQNCFSSPSVHRLVWQTFLLSRHIVRYLSARHNYSSHL